MPSQMRVGGQCQVRCVWVVSAKSDAGGWSVPSQMLVGGQCQVRCGWVVSAKSRPPYPGKDAQFSLYKTLNIDKNMEEKSVSVI